MAAQEIAEVIQLLNAVEKADGRKPLNNHLWIDLRLGGRAGFAGLTARDPKTSQPIAYCQISRGNGSWSLDLVVHPNFRTQTLEIGKSLFTDATKIISEEGGGHVHWWVCGPSEIDQQLADLFSFKAGRNLLQMRVELPLSPEVLSATKSIQTRSFVVGADDAAWLTVNNRAFAQHPEQGGWTTEVLRSRQSEKWFDPNGFLLHHIKTNATDQLAGFCWTKIDKDTDPSVGEIYVIAVDPQFHGQGLGRALTVAGLNHLAKANATTGMLFVDRDNDAAVMTYTKLGFTIHDIEQAFVGEISSHI